LHPLNEERGMLDVIFLCLGCGFLGLMALYALALDRE
jgi:hypothetical protein